MNSSGVAFGIRREGWPSRRTEPIEEIEVTDFAIDFSGLGAIAKYGDKELQARLQTHLITVMLAAEFDDLSKVSALRVVAELAPSLDDPRWPKVLAAFERA